MPEPLVEVEDARVTFRTPGGVVRALDGVTLQVRKGETVAVVGESGCGKTTLAKAILGLQPLDSGKIALLGEPVTGVRPNLAERAGIVWQDPYASLDPRWRVGRSVLEPMRLLGRKADARRIFEDVGLDPNLTSRFPHQLSGGQRQRVAIGRALAPRPPLVICDEPTAALDLSIRAQILNLIKKLQAETGISFLYISHDLTTVRFLADRIAVMYLGVIVEEGPTEQVFQDPRHRYTQALLEAAPTLEKLRHLPEAPPGEIPDPRSTFAGCRYVGRCAAAVDLCAAQPPARSHEQNRAFYCHAPIRPIESSTQDGGRSE